MAKKEKKVDRVVIPCTVSFKKKFKKICDNTETDMAGFGMVAINEKIKRDNLGEK